MSWPRRSTPRSARAGAGSTARHALAAGGPGYLGYVDAVIVHWLALPEDQRTRSRHMIADVAAGLRRRLAAV